MNKQESQSDKNFDTLEQELGFLRLVAPSRMGLKQTIDSVTLSDKNRLTSQGNRFWKLRTFFEMRYVVPALVVLLLVIGARGYLNPSYSSAGDELALLVEQIDLAERTELDDLLAMEDEDLTSMEVAMADI